MYYEEEPFWYWLLVRFFGIAVISIGIFMIWTCLPSDSRYAFKELFLVLQVIEDFPSFVVGSLPSAQTLMNAPLYTVGVLAFAGLVTLVVLSLWNDPAGTIEYLIIRAVMLLAWALVLALAWVGVMLLWFLFAESRLLSMGELLAFVEHWDKGGPALVSIILAAVGLLGVPVLLVNFTPDMLPSEGVFHQRGRSLLSYKEALAAAKKLLGKDDDSICWGWLKLPSRIATTHFALIGSTGSGKTILIRMLMQSVLPSIGKGRDVRALVYDAKQDSMSMLAGIAPGAEIILLNPFDARGVAWDMAKDITAPTTAQQVATILIPEDKSSQPFFSDAARHLLTGVLISLIQRKGGAWDFRDVLLALGNKERLEEVLRACPATIDIAAQYLYEGNTARNVMSTVATKMQRYHFVAAAWHRAKRKISLREWLESESILVLGNDEATRTALDAINQVIFKRLSELILAQSESEARRTWIFLDELRQAGKLNGLSSLLTKGRSKGTCVVLGYQDIEGLRDVYGRQLANEIAGQCANKAVLRCDSPETAQWASTLFGWSEVREVSHSTSETHDDRLRKSANQRFTKREEVLPSQIMELKPTSPFHGMQGYFITPVVGVYYAHIGGDSIERELVPPDRSVFNVVRRPDSEQYLVEQIVPKVESVLQTVKEEQEVQVVSGSDIFSIKR